MVRADDHCPECGVFVKPQNLPSHLRKAHGQEEAASRMEKRSPSARSRPGVRTVPTWIVVAVGLVAVLASGAYVASRVSPQTPGEPTPLTEMCVQHGGLSVHNHVQLAIAILGDPFTIPENIGIVSNTCYRPFHTHAQDVPGRIHIELPTPRTVYLKDFFAIWGQPFARDRILNRVADATHEVVMSVNGAASTAYEDLPLIEGQDIRIDYRVR